MYLISKRIFDICSSLIALLLFSPVIIIISLWIALDSPGGIFYRQTRVGKNQKEFDLFKFRSMRPNSDKAGQITIGNDSRVTKVGRFIRRFKIDEVPQLINILKGDMSVVGPRPEVPKYVQMYSQEQLKVLMVLPGLTDYASIEYLDEQKILGAANDPDKAYIEEVMPAKLKLNLKYIADRGFWLDIKLVFKTIGKIFL
ncbi:MAG: lipopolysaccharide/colanic/teichoic acid biosynthesis glycosyltransferase [Crocinitomix sp.]|jgi:lipopolysaccharide/colanic/teichoic acid biosynthesis glycosyltransferase